MPQLPRFAVVALVAAFTACLPSRPRVVGELNESFYVRDATLPVVTPVTVQPPTTSHRQFDKCVQMLVGNHSPIPGPGFVFSLRHDYDVSPERIDDESFEQLSIQLDNAMFDVWMRLDSPGVRVYYSRGASAWVGRCAGEIGQSATGMLILRRHDRDEIEVGIDAVIVTVDAQSGVTAKRPIKWTARLAQRR